MNQEDKQDNFFDIRRIPLYSFWMTYISGIIQISSLWNISYEYIRFFSTTQLIQDMFIISIPFLASLVFIYFYYSLMIVNNIYLTFIWINDTNQLCFQKKLLLKKLFTRIMCLVICILFFYGSIELVFEKNNINDKLIFCLFISISLICIIINSIKILLLLKIIMTSREVRFDSRFLDRNFYSKFLSKNYWINWIRAGFNNQKVNEKEIDIIKDNVLTKIFIWALITYAITLINGFIILKISQNNYTNLSKNNINFIETENRIMQKYNLTKRPLFVYMNSDYIFYNLNTNINIHSENQKDNQIILIVKRNDLFEFK